MSDDENNVVRDLSRNVVSLARAVDRLPPGDYVIRLTKPAFRQNWRAAIIREERLRFMEIGDAEDT